MGRKTQDQNSVEQSSESDGSMAGLSELGAGSCLSRAACLDELHQTGRSAPPSTAEQALGEPPDYHTRELPAYVPSNCDPEHLPLPNNSREAEVIEVEQDYLNLKRFERTPDLIPKKEQLIETRRFIEELLDRYKDDPKTDQLRADLADWDSRERGVLYKEFSVSGNKKYSAVRIKGRKGKPTLHFVIEGKEENSDGYFLPADNMIAMGPDFDICSYNHERRHSEGAGELVAYLDRILCDPELKGVFEYLGCGNGKYGIMVAMLGDPDYSIEDYINNVLEGSGHKQDLESITKRSRWWPGGEMFEWVVRRAHTSQQGILTEAGAGLLSQDPAGFFESYLDGVTDYFFSRDTIAAGRKATDRRWKRAEKKAEEFVLKELESIKLIREQAGSSS